MNYLSTTFSPSMLTRRAKANVEEMDYGAFRLQVQKLVRAGELIPAVGHENTAFLLREKLNIDIELFARVNIELKPGDTLFCAIPRGRAQFRYFFVEVIYTKL